MVVMEKSFSIQDERIHEKVIHYCCIFKDLHFSVCVLVSTTILQS